MNHRPSIFRTLALLAALAALIPMPVEAQQTKSAPAAKPRVTKPAPGPNADAEVAPAKDLADSADETAVARAQSPAQTPQPQIDDGKAWELAAPLPGTSSYMLGTGDIVRLNVFQQPDMTMETRVSEAGTITVPLLGPVAVAGGTAKQAEARIAALLRNRGFVRNPQVNITILEFKSRQVAVLGHVNRPGRYALQEGSYRVTDLLSLAGGVIPGAADEVTLVRARDGKPQRFSISIPELFKSGDFQSNLEVYPNDTLYVDKAPVFYIYGEVQRPGSFRLEKGMSVMQALSVGGGITARGTEKNMRLTRRDARGRTVTLTPSMNDLLQADDVIFVRESLF